MHSAIRTTTAAVALSAVALALGGCHPQPRVSMADTFVREGGVLVFPVRLQAPSGNDHTAHGDVDLYCTTSDISASAGADYVARTNAFCGTIPEGSTTTTVRVRTLADAETETNEDLWLQLRVVGPAGIVDGRAKGIIG